MHSKRCLGLVLLAAVTLAACGGSSASSSSSTTTTKKTTLTKAEYLVQANAICAAMNKRIASIPDPGNDLAKQAAAIDETGAVTSAALRALRKLSVPAGQSAAVNEIYAKVGTLVAGTAQYAAALRSGDQAAAARIGSQLDAISSSANDLSKAYGLTVCAS